MRRLTARFFRAVAGVPAALLVAVRATLAALRRPGVQVGLHGVALVGVLGAVLWTGMYVVPSGAQTRPAAAPSGEPSAGGVPSTAPTGGAPVATPPTIGPPSGAPSGPTAPPPGGTGSRPQDALGGWARDLAHLEIPTVALQAYGYAELYLAQTQPECHITWPTLAGIGRIESNHGRFNGAQLLTDGRSNPPVIGLPLDGGPQRKEIRDTDNGELDGDPTYDRAVGPMQFIPTTWATWATDADGDGRADPFDIDDAAVAAARYLCAGNRDLATGEGWWSAILSYNNLESYVRDVFAAADRYGRLSQTGG